MERQKDSGAQGKVFVPWSSVCTGTLTSSLCPGDAVCRDDLALPFRAIGALVSLVAMAVAFASPAAAQPKQGDVTAQAGFDQELGAKLPLGVHFRDESGRQVALSDYFGRRPVILAPVYYGCPLLCGQVLAGLSRALKPLSLEAGKDFDVIAFSINPDESPTLSQSKKIVFLERYDRPGSESGCHFLTGESASIAALAKNVGFRYTQNPETKLFTHAAGVVVVTPEGVVSRYFFGIDYPPKELQLELERARAGRIGSPIGRLLLLCYDYEAATGKYTLSILRLIRVLGTATAVSLAGLVFFLVRREAKERRAKGRTEEGRRASIDEKEPAASR